LYRFSFGPWNIHEGSDPFGPAVRSSIDLRTKLSKYRDLGFEGVQFHDDDVVGDIDLKSAPEIEKQAKDLRNIMDGLGLKTEIMAPRLWESPNTIDGAFTSNRKEDRQYALERAKRSIDLARIMGTNNLVLWLAREGTYIRESKDPIASVQLILEAIDELLQYDSEIKIMIEPKPNEPVDHAFIPTIGHALALAAQTIDPARVGGLIESAHCILAGLDPADEMGFALAAGKLWSVHLNDQNGLKYDQDKSFGSDNLRRAFNQVRVLESYGYGKNGEYIGLDVKAMRTQPQELACKHLEHSRTVFLSLVERVKSFDKEKEHQFIEARDYESLDLYVIEHLMGR